MKKLFKKTRTNMLRGKGKKLFIKDMPNTKFKKRKNKRVLKFLKFFDFKIEKSSIIYIYIGLLLVVFGVIGFLIFGPYFQVQTINITREDKLSNINIAYKSLENIRGSHIMQNDRINISEAIKSYQPNIKDISVSRDFPDKLDIVINSHDPIFNTKVNDKNYIILENGTFIPEKEDLSLRNLIILTNKISASIPDYKNVIDQQYMNQIISIYNEIKVNIIRINITEVRYYPVEREVIVSIEGGTQLIFDLEKAIIPQVKRLAIFDTENIQIDVAGIVYIDLRVADKVFYCTTETEYQCVINLKNIYPQPLSQE